MRDWQAFVREHFHGKRQPSDQGRILSDQAIEELAQHVEETWRAARAAGRSEAEALEAARRQLENPPARLPANMIAPASGGLAGLVATAFRRRPLRHADAARAPRIYRRRRSSRSRSASAPTPPSSASSGRCCSSRCRFHEPDRLVMLWEHTAGNPQDTYIVSAPNYLDWQRGVKAFEQTGIWEPLNFNFSGDGEAERVPGHSHVRFDLRDARCEAAARTDLYGRGRRTGPRRRRHQRRVVAPPLRRPPPTSSARRPASTPSRSRSSASCRRRSGSRAATTASGCRLRSTPRI